MHQVTGKYYHILGGTDSDSRGIYESNLSGQLNAQRCEVVVFSVHNESQLPECSIDHVVVPISDMRKCLGYDRWKSDLMGNKGSGRKCTEGQEELLPIMGACGVSEGSQPSLLQVGMHDPCVAMWL